MLNLWRKLRQQDVIDQLTDERDYLDAKCAEFERFVSEYTSSYDACGYFKQVGLMMLKNWDEVK